MRDIKRLLIGLLFILATAPAAAAMCEAKSEPHTVALLELYTSEGCSSCPPADRWFSELPSKGFDAKHLVPLAFHVDYWNDLGWEDRFSQAAFSERQAGIAQRSRASATYTPGFFLGGREYYPWRWRNLDKAVAAVNRTPARASIQLRLNNTDAQLRIHADASANAGRVGLYVAITENDLHTNVRAGENRGKALAHSAVVRQLLGPAFRKPDGSLGFNQTVALDPSWKTANLRVAAFVQDLNDAAVWQAISMPICR